MAFLGRVLDDILDFVLDLGRLLRLSPFEHHLAVRLGKVPCKLKMFWKTTKTFYCILEMTLKTFSFIF